MPKHSDQSYSSLTPLLHEDADALSLHFGFPTIQSRMLKSAPERLVLDYTRTMMAFLLFQPTPRSIAMIGLGGGSLAKYCHHKLPGADFTAVEISPEVIALRRDFGIPDDGPNFRIIEQDGAAFVREHTDSLDVLLVDGFDSSGQPDSLCCMAFYDACRDLLSQEGVLTVNLCADDPYCSLYIDRIGQAFSGNHVCAEADEGGNIIVFASNSSRFPPSFFDLTDRLRQLEAAHPVELDLTAQKILGGKSSTSTARRKHRRR